MSDERSGVKSATRVVQLIEALSSVDGPLAAGALQDLTGIPRSSLHALLSTLSQLHWIAADPVAQTYAIGPGVLLAGTAYLDRDPAIPFATEALEEARTKLGRTVHYARRDGRHVLYLASRFATVQPEAIIPRIGRRLPAHATALGQALLSQLSLSELEVTLGGEPLERLTPHTVVDRRGLDEVLTRTECQGFGHEIEENTLGVGCVAVTVPYRIPATDAISCSMPAPEATPERAQEVARILSDIASDLAARLQRAGIR